MNICTTPAVSIPGSECNDCGSLLARVAALERQIANITGLTVDSTLSTSSSNPVRNSTITNALAGKQNTLTAGANITISGNVISATGGGGSSVTVDSALSTSSSNPVRNSAITTALNGKQDTLTAGTGISISGGVISATGGGSSVTVDSALSGTSTNPVQNKAIYDKIASLESAIASVSDRVDDLEDGTCIDYSISWNKSTKSLVLSDGTNTQSEVLDGVQMEP